MTIRDLALSPLTGDIFVANGDLVTTGPDAAGIAQDIKQALCMFSGEDPVAPEDGMPWFQNVLGKNPDPGVLRQTFTDAILARDGVNTIETLSMSYDRINRKLAVDFKATGDANQLINSTSTITVPP